MKTPFTLIASMVALSLAHMELKMPPPLRSKYNNLTTDVDYSMTSPLDALGSDYPCKGFLSDLGTLAGGSTDSYAAGYKYVFELSGSARHGGGSCQVSLSTDEGITFKVIQSYIGNCPDVTNDSFIYHFRIPLNTPLGLAVFAWTWFNKIGNREMYMNCASITITSGINDSATTAFASRLDIFVANVGNGCSTVDSSNLEFPDPGPDILRYNADTKPPIGSCALIASSLSSSCNVNATTSRRFTSTISLVNPSQAHVRLNGSSSDGKCGGLHTCTGSKFGDCCSKFGFCGATNDYCGDGCNPSFGICNELSNFSSSTLSALDSSQPSGAVAANTRTIYLTTTITRTVTAKKRHLRRVLYIPAQETSISPLENDVY